MSVLALVVDDHSHQWVSPPNALARRAVPVTVAVIIGLAAAGDLAASHPGFVEFATPVPAAVPNGLPAPVSGPSVIDIGANLGSVATSRGPCRLGAIRVAGMGANGRRALRRASPKRNGVVRHRRATSLFATFDRSMSYRLDFSGALADTLDPTGKVAAFDAMARPLGVAGMSAESAILPKASTSVAASRPLPLDLPFADGHLAPAARAGLLNGQPAAALGVRYRSGDTSIRIDAAGATEMTNVTDLSAMRKSFKVQTVASITFD